MVGCLVATGGTASAQPITSRDYAIELYEGVAIGDSTMTGMGGAGAANIGGSAGVLLNASAAAVRRTTDNDSWSWDYHLDFLTGKYSSDYDNNGQATPPGLEGGASLVTGGLALRRGKWSFAITATGQSAPVDNSMPELNASAARVKLAVARWIPKYDLAVGAGIQTVIFSLAPVRDAAAEDVFSLTGGGLIAGATWLPRMQSFRVALARSRAASSGAKSSRRAIRWRAIRIPTTASRRRSSSPRTSSRPGARSWASRTGSRRRRGTSRSSRSSATSAR
jgi:hypothetical protein